MSNSTATRSPSATLYATGQPALNNHRTEVAFVLDNLADWQTLAAGVRPGVEVVVLDSRGDGLAQMADWLAQKAPGSVDAIHLLGHGSSGAIDLGGLTLSNDNLNQHANTLAQIGTALTESGDWLVYGCNVAAGDAGVQFVGRLAQLTGADVAASTDLTGAANKNGDWVLESSLGGIEAVALHPDAYSAVLINTTPTLNTPLSFATKADFSTGAVNTGNSPYAVTSADIDGDGKPDLITSIYSQTKVSVFRNTSTGSGNVSFAAQTDVGSGTNPISVVSVDIDGDGKKDVITANAGSNSVSVLRNTSSSGSVSFDTKVDVTTGTNPQSVTSVDVDGDGKLDLLVANQNNNTVSVLRNTSSSGAVSFATKADFTTGTSPKSVASVDIDGDGKLDLLVANGNSSTVSVLRNTSSSGTVSFAAKVDINTLPGPVSVTSADVDGDGKPDLVVSSGNLNNASVSVLRNTSSGSGVVSFDTRVDYALGGNYNPMTVISMDANGDGKLDLVTSNQGNISASVLKNTSTGSGSVSFATPVTFATSYLPTSVTSADVDGDGRADLIAANSYSPTPYLSVLRNTYGLTDFTEQTQVAVNAAILINDADGDADWTGGSLKLQITANAEAADTLSLPTSNPGGSAIWVNTTGNLLMAGSTQIGSADAASVNNGTAWTFTFIASATNALVQATGQAIKFNNSSNTPGTSARNVTFTVNDSSSAAATHVQQISITAVNDVPTLTSISTLTGGIEDTEKTISFADLQTAANEADVDGTVTAFVVSAVTTGSLKIGTDAASATPWVLVSNATLDATHNAYWTPALNANGTLSAFTVKAKDDGAAQSSSPIQVKLDVTAVNDAPTVANVPANQTATAGTLFGFTFDVNTFADVDTGQTLTYSATKSDESALPSWLSFDASTRSFSGTPAVGDAGTLSVKVTATDNGASALSVFTPFDIAVSTVPSVSSIVRTGGAAALTNAASVNYSVTFSESVTGVDLGDFTLAKTASANGSIASITGSGSSYTVSVTGVSGDGSLGLSLKSSGTGIASASSVAIAGGYSSGQTYTLDHIAPTASITLSDSALSIGETAIVTITFSEAVSGFNNADLTVANGTLSPVGSSDGGITWTATFTPAASVADTTNVITLDNTGVTDAAGNAGSGSTNSANYTVDTRPTVTLSVNNASVAEAAGSSMVTATLSAAASTDTTVTLAATGTATGSGTDYTLASNTITIMAGQTTGTTTVTTVQDTLDEADETIIIDITSVGGGDGAFENGTQQHTVTITDGPALVYGTTSFSEAAANNGTVTATSTITLTNDTFTGNVGDALGSVTNVPAGLTAVLVKASATTASLSFTGNAANHANANDVSNLTVTFGNADFTGGSASGVTGATKADLMIDFADPTPTPPPTPPTDTDGVPDTVENATPGLPPAAGGTPVAGDGNGDGVVDSQQSGVTSVSFRETPTAVSNPGSAPTAFVSLVADSLAGKIDSTDANSATLSNVRQLDAPANLPEGMNLPLGLISFSATVGTGINGAAVTETFSMYVDADLGVNGYWKQNDAGTWVNLASSVHGGAMVLEGGKLRLDFALTDGGEFDADGLVNGVITDPGAAGYMPQSLVGYTPDLPDGGFWF